MWDVVKLIVGKLIERGERPTAEVIKQILATMLDDVETRMMLVAQLAELARDAHGVLDAFTPKGTIPRFMPDMFDVTDAKEPTEK